MNKEDVIPYAGSLSKIYNCDFQCYCLLKCLVQCLVKLQQVSNVLRIRHQAFVKMYLPGPCIGHSAPQTQIPAAETTGALYVAVGRLYSANSM